MVTAPVRRELVRWIQTKGLSERRGLQIVRMSPIALRYVPRPDRNKDVRQRIIELAQRHRRYGVGMIHLKLRQAGGEPINYKRVERLYQLEKLHIRRRRRKKIPVSERQPRIRPGVEESEPNRGRQFPDLTARPTARQYTVELEYGLWFLRIRTRDVSIGISQQIGRTSSPERRRRAFADGRHGMEICRRGKMVMRIF